MLAVCTVKDIELVSICVIAVYEMMRIGSMVTCKYIGYFKTHPLQLNALLLILRL